MTACTSARPGADASMDTHRATPEGDHMNDQAPPTADRADRAVTIRSLVKRPRLRLELPARLNPGLPRPSGARFR